ncbi:MAG TPA: transglycosylase SLT domain-containing protein [Terriglobales bacterium]|nr:transglycosylase SLT domain-containing protein [Terriglobales bacterium]
MKRFIASLLLLSLFLPLPVFAQVSKKKPPASAKKPGSSKAKAKPKAPTKSPRQVALESARAKRMRQAFIASADLRPMATQLLATRSKSAFAGVETYAKTHVGTDAGSLAWLVTGYARSLDGDYRQAVIALKNAKPHARELGDYVDFLLASAYRNLGQQQEVIIALDGFEKRFPESLFRQDAALVRARSLLSTGAKDLAIEILENNRVPARADVELSLGQAYRDAGRTDDATKALRQVYFQMPLSGEADEAAAVLQSIGAFDSTSAEMRKQRADLLIKGKRYTQAIKELRALSAESPAPAYQVALANALYKSDREEEARKVLTAMGASEGEPNAQRLYLLAELARSDRDDDTHARLLEEARTSSPNSGWFQEALMSFGNKFLLRNEFANAAAAYSEIAQRFPAGKYGPGSHWKAAWLQYRQGKFADAKAAFDRHIATFPSSAEVPNALYWRGRIAEKDGDIQKARSCYQKLNERFRNYYYAMLARERLREIKLAPVEDDPTFARIPSAPDPSTIFESSDDVTDLRLARARLLSNAAMYDQAQKELESAAKDRSNRWVVGEIVKLQRDAGKPHIALQTLKRAYPSYFAIDVGSLPRPMLETLFPRPYWPDVKASAAENSLDPYLVASLIRQESEFNPMAVSHANAYGLMQLLPSVGKQLAKEVKLKPFSTARLLEPQANLKLGTRYFRQMIEGNGGEVEYALAAYNAGSNRVSDWRANGNFKDMAEFVESIPFTETREYVQAIVRNVEVYKRIYATEVAQSN